MKPPSAAPLGCRDQVSKGCLLPRIEEGGSDPVKSHALKQTPATIDHRLEQDKLKQEQEIKGCLQPRIEKGASDPVKAHASQQIPIKVQPHSKKKLVHHHLKMNDPKREPQQIQTGVALHPEQKHSGGSTSANSLIQLTS